MKWLNVNLELKNFRGEVIKDKENGNQPITVKDVLLKYLELAHRMGCQNKTAAYCAGLAIGTGGERCLLEQVQYDVIKDLVDRNEFEEPMGKKKEPLYGIVVQQQVKKIIDEAETVKDK